MHYINSISNTEGNMEELEFEYVEEQRSSWIMNAVVNGLSTGMNLALLVGGIIYIVG